MWYVDKCTSRVVLVYQVELCSSIQHYLPGTTFCMSQAVNYVQMRQSRMIDTRLHDVNSSNSSSIAYSRLVLISLFALQHFRILKTRVSCSSYSCMAAVLVALAWERDKQARTDRLAACSTIPIIPIRPLWLLTPLSRTLAVHQALLLSVQLSYVCMITIVRAAESVSQRIT